jgi:hypothetical protein
MTYYATIRSSYILWPNRNPVELTVDDLEVLCAKYPDGLPRGFRLVPSGLSPRERADLDAQVRRGGGVKMGMGAYLEVPVYTDRVINRFLIAPRAGVGARARAHAQRRSDES